MLLLENLAPLFCQIDDFWPPSFWETHGLVFENTVLLFLDLRLKKETKSRINSSVIRSFTSLQLQINLISVKYFRVVFEPMSNLAPQFVPGLLRVHVFHRITGTV